MQQVLATYNNPFKKTLQEKVGQVSSVGGLSNTQASWQSTNGNQQRLNSSTFQAANQNRISTPRQQTQTMNSQIEKLNGFVKKSQPGLPEKKQVQQQVYQNTAIPYNQNQQASYANQRQGLEGQGNMQNPEDYMNVDQMDVEPQYQQGDNSFEIPTKNSQNRMSLSPIPREVPQQQREETQKQETQGVKQYNQPANTQKFQIHRLKGKFVSTKPEEERKIKKVKSDKLWLQNYSIIGVEFPQKIPTGSGMNKKWEVSFTYTDGLTTKKHRKKVRFGKVGIEDYVDHHDLARKDKYLSHLRNTQNPFKGNFWSLQLLNNSDSLEQNYLSILKQL